MPGKKLTQLTQVTTFGDDAKVYIVDPDRTAGDQSVGMDKDALGAALGTSSAASNPVENEYADITALLADQGNQTTNFFQYVLDASADPNVTSGAAYYEKLATSTTTLADDYRLLTDDEAAVVEGSNAYRVFKIEAVQSDASPLTSTSAGQIGFEYNTGSGLVTGILFNKAYSDVLINFYQSDVNIKFYVRKSKEYQYTAVEVADWTTVSTHYYHVAVTDGNITASDLAVNDKVEMYMDIGGAGGASPLTTKGDLYTYDTANARLPVGENGQVLVADSSQSSGLRWGNSSVEGSTIYNVNQYNIPIAGVNGIISGNYVYAGVGNNFVKWNESEGSTTIQAITGTVTDWRCVFEDSRGNIFFSPMDSQSNTIGTGENGLYKYVPSTDTVTQEIVLSDQESIWGFDEDSNGNLFGGVYSFGTDNGKIYKSTDGGDNWSIIYTPTYTITGGENHTHVVHVDQTNDDIYICGGDEYGGTLNFISTDGGDSFSEILGSIGSSNQFTACLAISGARFFGSDVSGEGKIYKTTNNTSVTTALDTGIYQNCFFIKQSDLTDWIYAGFKLDPTSTSPLRSEIYISKDLGTTWDLYYTIDGLSASEGFWFASEFNNGKMLIGYGNIGSFNDSLIIDETQNYTASGVIVQTNNSRNLTQFDHNRLLIAESGGEVVLTVPSSGLQDNFRCDIDVITGSVKVEDGGSGQLEFNSKFYLNADSFGKIYRKADGKYRNPLEWTSSVPLSVGLVASYNFDSNSNDETGNAHNGTDTNMSYATAGVISNSADFNGSTAYIEITDSDDFSMTDGATDLACSFEAWVYFDVADEGYILNKQNPSSQGEYIIAYAGGNLTAIFIDDVVGPKNIRANYAWSPSTATWYHIVVTYDGSESENGIEIYLDNSLLTTTKIQNGVYTGMTNGTSNVGLGRNHSADSVYLDGRLDITRFWKNRELTSGEVSLLYNSGSGRTYSELSSLSE